MLTTHINTIHGTHYNTCINTIHGTHYNINTIHGTHCTINTTHSTSTFKNNHLCEQKLLPLLKITYYIGGDGKTISMYNVQKQGIYFLWVGLFKKKKTKQTKQNISKDKYR